MATSLYDIFKNSIYTGDFELSDIKSRIMSSWAYGSLTDDQRDELIAAARENAKPEASYASLQEQINALGVRVKANEDAITALKSGTSSGDDSGSTTEEYPEYVQPTGATDAYQVGDQISYNGKKYKCVLANCVWNPDDYPAGWKEVTDA